MSGEQDVAAIAAGLTPGARRAVCRMTGEWQFGGKATFDHNGAWNASWKAKAAVEREVQKDGKYSGYAFRLTPLGLAVRAHLLSDAPTQDSVSDVERLTRPIIGIENRTPQEVFDILCDRLRRYFASQSVPINKIGEDAK
jgi:hypothetical protein